jgi:hypothetical protein
MTGKELDLSAEMRLLKGEMAEKDEEIKSLRDHVSQAMLLMMVAAMVIDKLRDELNEYGKAYPDMEELMAQAARSTKQ